MSNLFEEVHETPDLSSQSAVDTLELLRDDLCQSEPRPSDFTIQDAMDKYGLSRNQAVRRLNDLVRQGKLEKIRYRNTNYYRLVG